MAVSFVLAVTICATAHAQTDVALSVYGAFGGTTTGRAVSETPANSAGGMIELRHIVNPFVGFEATYGLNRANQIYYAPTFCSLCVNLPVSANAHQITGDWVFSFRPGRVRPFGLVGAGVVYYQPLQSIEYNRPAPTTSVTTPVFVYGAGIDWKIVPHIGFRLQYRGNFHNAPDMTKVYGPPVPESGNGTVYAHTAEPAIGVYYKF
jgi:opacity protein-like surface antigen